MSRPARAARPAGSPGAGLDRAFAALSDPTRRAMIRTLMERPTRAGELARAVGISPPAASRHLRALKRAGLVAEDGVDDDARVRVYRVRPRAFRPMGAWIEEIEAFWAHQLEAFRAHAEAGRPRGRSG